MHYEINVSKDGKHLFATHERSMYTRFEYDKILAIFIEKFPENEGYKISGKLWHASAKILR